MTEDALARPVWSALTTRQAHLALGTAQARRLAPDYGLFAAARDSTPESLTALAALVPPSGHVWVVETTPFTPPGPFTAQHALCLQMAAQTVAAGPNLPILDLTDADGPDMLALATLTRPGPFFARTHQLGRFVGIRHAGRLVAMAGERMKGPGFTEVSGVCTHPDHRGQGYAGALMRIVARRILARAERPVLHVYASNTGAIALYRTLGFSTLREVTMSVVSCSE